MISGVLMCALVKPFSQDIKLKKNKAKNSMNDILYLFKPSTVTVDDSCTFYIAYDLMSKATTRHPQSLYEKYKNKASCK